METRESSASFVLRPVGHVESSLRDLADAPMQGMEGGPDAWLVFDDAVREAAGDLQVGEQILVLTWLHLADRSVLVVHPRGDTTRPQRGVFSTRSQHRPNPIGIHLVEVAAVEGNRVLVHHMETIDGTPILDVKPVLHRSAGA